MNATPLRVTVWVLTVGAAGFLIASGIVGIIAKG